MCKIAGNMLIRTLSESPDKDLHAHSIDPGYVSGINQYGNFPLKSDDGAARILDPIICFYNGDKLPCDHVNLRNYRPSKW